MNTPPTWADIGFEVEFTGDGSPSLRLLSAATDAQSKGESMHHSGGAAEETELIYGREIRRCFQRVSKPCFISVGLGLGYVELTIAREALLKGDLNFSLRSFELVPALKVYFMSWLKNEALPFEITGVYDQVLSYVLKGGEELSGEEVKEVLKGAYREQRWQLEGALDERVSFRQESHAILFDAFSAKTTPSLWTEEFLIQFLNSCAAEDALLSTYASRTTLKNALKAAHFKVEVREGFKGKRNSTLGLKGLFAESAAVETSTP